MAENNISSADVQALLNDVEYPAPKQALVDKATQNGASEEIISIIDRLPDHEYNGPTDVSKELGNILG